ncbi:MAG: peptidoglycan-binding domain-containing protein [Pseudomonadota bacterium]
MKNIFMIAAVAALGACQMAEPVTRAEPEPLRASLQGPPNADPDKCWGSDTTPAVYETVTENTLLKPAEIGSDGTVRSAPVYKTETRQTVVREPADIWFEIPCAEALTPEFVSALQRALAARGLYSGPITGDLDKQTGRAIRAFQAPQGLNSTTLSTAAARRLGLVAIARDEASISG